MGFLSRLFGSSQDGNIVDNYGQRWQKVESNLRGRYVLSPVGQHKGGGTVRLVVNNSIVEANANSVVFNEQGQPVSWSETDCVSMSCIGE